MTTLINILPYIFKFVWNESKYIASESLLKDLGAQSLEQGGENMKRERLLTLQEILKSGRYAVDVKSGTVISDVTKKQICVFKANEVKKVTLYWIGKAHNYYLGEIIAVKLGWFDEIKEPELFRVKYGDRENVTKDTIRIERREKIEKDGGTVSHLLSIINKIKKTA